MSAEEPIQINGAELATFPEAAVKLILALVARIEKLEAQLQQNSKNYSLPPSTDRFQSKASPQQRIDGKKRNRGGQKGHKKNDRLTWPPFSGPENRKLKLQYSTFKCLDCL